jgi:hypothetical protein
MAYAQTFRTREGEDMDRRIGGLVLVLGLGIHAGGCMHPRADVPYVQTPHEVVAEMLRLAGVGDRVSFREADLFQVDLSDATVVTLYLSRALNLRLRPKLLRELRPGARVVSHDFDMGEWAPTQTSRVELRDRGARVYLWVVTRRRP